MRKRGGGSTHGKFLEIMSKVAKINVFHLMLLKYELFK